MGYPLDYPLELDSPEHYVFESEDLEDEDIIPIGSTVRSYDFVVGKHILRDDCYFEGVIEKFEPVPTCSPNCNHYIVRTTKIVRNGEEEDIIEGSNDYFSTHWNNYGVIPLEMVETFEADSYFPCEACDSEDDPNNLDTKRTQIRVDDGDAGIKLDICDSCLEKWYAGVLFDEEDLEVLGAATSHYWEEYEAETYTPPAAAVSAAKKGLSQRKKWGRGGLSPAEAKSQGIDSGVTRARKISSGKVSRHDVRRMSAFNRHRKNNKPSKKMPDGGPTAGTIAWNLWGGSAGVNWAKKKSATMNAEDRPEEERMTRVEAEALASKMINLLQPYADSIDVCGSYRRGREDPGDLDIVVILKPRVTLPEVVENLANEYTAVNWVGEKKTQMVIDGVKVDVRTTTPRAKGAALLYFTGPAGYNIGIRRSAKSRGMKLNEYGIFDRETNEYLGGATEEEIYEILGKNFRPATERRAEEEVITRSLGEIPDWELRMLYQQGKISKMQMEIGIGLKMDAEAEEVQEFNAMVKAPKGWNKAGITEKVMMMEVMMQEARLQQALLELETNIRVGLISEKEAMAMFAKLMG